MLVRAIIRCAIKIFSQACENYHENGTKLDDLQRVVDERGIEYISKETMRISYENSMFIVTYVVHHKARGKNIFKNLKTS